METEIDNAPKLLLEAAKIINFVFIEPYCKRHMNRSEGAKNVGPPKKKQLRSPTGGRASVPQAQLGHTLRIVMSQSYELYG